MSDQHPDRQLTRISWRGIVIAGELHMEFVDSWASHLGSVSRSLVEFVPPEMSWPGVTLAHTGPYAIRLIVIAVTYEPNWLNLRDLVGTSAHLTVTAEGRHPLPFTPTGFQSLFLAPAEVDDGGLAAFVTAWLDAAAESIEWKAHDTSQSQLELF